MNELINYSSTPPVTIEIPQNINQSPQRKLHRIDPAKPLFTICSFLDREDHIKLICVSKIFRMRIYQMLSNRQWRNNLLSSIVQEFMLYAAALYKKLGEPFQDLRVKLSRDFKPTELDHNLFDEYHNLQARLLITLLRNFMRTSSTEAKKLPVLNTPVKQIFLHPRYFGNLRAKYKEIKELKTPPKPGYIRSDRRQRYLEFKTALFMSSLFEKIVQNSPSLLNGAIDKLQHEVSFTKEGWPFLEDIILKFIEANELRYALTLLFHLYKVNSRSDAMRIDTRYAHKQLSTAFAKNGDWKNAILVRINPSYSGVDRDEASLKIIEDLFSDRDLLGDVSFTKNEPLTDERHLKTAEILLKPMNCHYYDGRKACELLSHAYARRGNLSKGLEIIEEFYGKRYCQRWKNDLIKEFSSEE